VRGTVVRGVEAVGVLARFVRDEVDAVVRVGASPRMRIRCPGRIVYGGPMRLRRARASQSTP